MQKSCTTSKSVVPLHARKCLYMGVLRRWRREWLLFQSITPPLTTPHKPPKTRRIQCRYSPSERDKSCNKVVQQNRRLRYRSPLLFSVRVAPGCTRLYQVVPGCTGCTGCTGCKNCNNHPVTPCIALPPAAPPGIHPLSARPWPRRPCARPRPCRAPSPRARSRARGC